MARCLVLDLDGTLTDSLPDIAAALNRSLARHGQAPLPLEQVRPMVGDGIGPLHRRGYAARGLTPTDADMAEGLADYTANSTEGTVLYPGAMEALRALADDGWRLAVCTNKPAAPARVLLAHVGLLPLLAAVGAGDSFPAAWGYGAPDMAAGADAVAASFSEVPALCEKLRP
jgi:phosphoglycolate phosphatase